MTTLPKRRTAEGSFGRSTPVVAMWFLAVVAGMGVVLEHAYTPGESGDAPKAWPPGTHISRNVGGPTLIMFAHPHCPCTRASLGELANIAENCRGQFKAQVWFTKPSGTSDVWTNTAIWQQAAAIPGVTIYCDDLGTEASRFHAGTSGETMLYDQNGKLLFQGGITLSRGHAGDNPARSALEALLHHQISNQVQSVVYGCPLLSSRGSFGNAACPKK